MPRGRILLGLERFLFPHKLAVPSMASCLVIWERATLHLGRTFLGLCTHAFLFAGLLIVASVMSGLRLPWDWIFHVCEIETSLSV